MLKIHCDVCGAELTKPGALLFGPMDEESRTHKQHICVKCYKILLEYIAHACTAS